MKVGQETLVKEMRALRKELQLVRKQVLFTQRRRMKDDEGILSKETKARLEKARKTPLEEYARL